MVHCSSGFYKVCLFHLILFLKCFRFCKDRITLKKEWIGQEMREEQEAFDLHAADFDTVTLMVNVIMLTYME